jgi:hypothetical protein
VAGSACSCVATAFVARAAAGHATISVADARNVDIDGAAHRCSEQ